MNQGPGARQGPRWRWATLADAGSVMTGNTPSTSEAENYGSFIPFVKPSQLLDRTVDSGEQGLSQRGASKGRVAPAGAVLVSCIGVLGKTGLARVSVAFNQQINAVVFRPDVLPAFGFYYAQTLRSWLYAQSSATTLPIVNKGKFLAAPFPLVPIDEQCEIVAEIEKQFSRLDEAVANLQRVKAHLKRYKNALIQAGVEGRLVESEAGRATRAAKTYERGGAMLDRILNARRTNWRERAKYKEPELPKVDESLKLPEGWSWCGFEQVSHSNKHALKAGPFGSALKKEFYVESGYKIYGQEQVIRGDASFGDYFINEAKYQELSSCAVAPGDVLVSLVGTTGKVLVMPPGAHPGIINPRLLKLSLCQEHIAPQYAAYFLQSSWARTFFKRQAHGGTMEILNLGIIKALPVALPPIAEQHRIVAEVDRCLSIVREVEAEVDDNLKRAQALRQAVLQQAFHC